ncbi:hypothetical protein OUZ56_030126 [Daphnia magna]|uniref:Uncharacterized protein n=2 Tax=Daphnia magna TaxID=35525 RepID=A0ABQ9ZQC6_9CRUS|nr:hypothetical protein OUZ56_030126 [Daphnia magna]
MVSLEDVEADRSRCTSSRRGPLGKKRTRLMTDKITIWLPSLEMCIAPPTTQLVLAAWLAARFASVSNIRQELIKLRFSIQLRTEPGTE